MSKVLKVVAVVAAIAAAIPTGGGSLLGLGISAGAFTAISMAAAIGSSLLAKKPSSPANSPESIDRLNASIDPRTPRKSVVGSTAMSTDIRDQEYTDSQSQLHRFLVVASHRVAGIREIWFDDKCAWTTTGGIQGEYLGYLGVECYPEGNPANAKNISSRMGSTRRFTGLAWIYLRFKLTGNSKSAESPFASSVPTRITIIGDGAFVYDPRLDSTIPGGSGSCRAADQSTWVWNGSSSRNPALALLWYLLGWKINGKLAVGLGIPPERIDIDSFMTAANLCDEPVAKSSGGTEPRYRCDGVWSEGDAPTTVIDALKASMNADLDDMGGRIRLTVFHNDLASPVAHFGDDEIIGPLEWEQTPSLDQTFNIVRGSYTDSSTTALYQQVDYPQVELASVDGIDRIDTFNLPMVQSASQAQRLAKMRLQRQQYGGMLSTTVDITGWRVLKNDVVTISSTVLGWDHKKFRVAEIEFRVDGTVPITLREEHSDLYRWDASDLPAVVATAPTLYNRDLDEFIRSVVTPSYSDGTPIDNLRPAEPGATVGATPAEKAQISDLDTVVNEAKALAIEAKAKADLIAGSIGDGEVDLTEITDQIIALGGQVTDLTDTVGENETQISTTKLIAESARDNLAALTMSVGTLDTRVTSNKVALDRVDEDIAALTEIAETAGAKAQDSVTAVSDLAGSQATIAEKAETARARAESAIEATSTLSGDVATIRSQARAGSPNLLRFGGFEAGATGWTLTSGMTPRRDPVWGSVAHSFVSATGAPIIAAVSDFVAVTAGQTYTLAGDLLLFASSTVADAYLDRLYYDAAGAQVPGGDGGQRPIAASVDFANDPAKRDAVALAETVPAGATQCRVRLVVNPNGATVTAFGMREVKLEQGSAWTRFSGEASSASAFTALSDLTTQFAQVTIDADTANTNAGIALDAIESFEGDISLLYARAAIGVTVGVDGVSRWTGMEINGTTVGGGVNIHADLFRVTKPGTGQRTEYSDGNWRVYDSTGQLRAQWGVWS